MIIVQEKRKQISGELLENYKYDGGQLLADDND